GAGPKRARPAGTGPPPSARGVSFLSSWRGRRRSSDGNGTGRGAGGGRGRLGRVLLPLALLGLLLPLHPLLLLADPLLGLGDVLIGGIAGHRLAGRGHHLLVALEEADGSVELRRRVQVGHL